MAAFPAFSFTNDYSYFLFDPEDFTANPFLQDNEQQDFPTVMTTPIRSNGASRQDEGSFSVPNRKRNYESTSLYAPAGSSKSRRTTPVHTFDPFSSQADVAEGEAEFIDLTG
jgi:hypothetical protein